MIKVGICTCFENHNYGSMLQAYATYIKLEELGVECEFIDYKKKLSILEKVKWIPRFLNKYLMKEKVRILKKKLIIRKYPDIQKGDYKRYLAFERFARDYFSGKKTTYIGFQALKMGSKNYDVVLAGGDQLWIPSGLPTNFYNLMFAAEGVRRISYSTSFGVTKIPLYQKSRTINYLNQIEYIGVREKSGADLVQQLTSRKATIVLDPTLLLNQSEWIREIPDQKIVENDYIFCYFLGSNQEHRKAVTELKRNTGLPVYDMPYIDEFVSEDSKFDAIHLYDIDPAQFVNLIRHAKYICTDSFHCCAFSIIYHKKFIVFDRYNDPLMKSRNSRIANLCKITGLENRRYKDNILLQIENNIDYIMVDKRIESEKQKSLNFLKNALGIINTNEVKGIDSDRK